MPLPPVRLNLAASNRILCYIFTSKNWLLIFPCDFFFLICFCHVVAPWIFEVCEVSWGLWALRITTQLHTLDPNRDGFYLKMAFVLERNMICSISQSCLWLSGNLHWVSCVSSDLPGRQAAFLWCLNKLQKIITLWMRQSPLLST